MDYPFHPLRKGDPLPTESAIRARMQDIREHGLKHRILLFQGHILVGRTDYLACKRLNIYPRVRILGFSPDIRASIAREKARRLQPTESQPASPELPDVTPKETAQEPMSESPNSALQQSPAARKQAQVTAVREYVRRLAVSIGIRAAARQYGLKESRVLNWAWRYGWHIGKRKHPSHNPVNRCRLCGQPVIIR
jgi:hypothetical protein